jgi:hypothetical protein
MLKNAPLSKINAASAPLIFAVIVGLDPIMVIGSSALEILHFSAAGTGAVAALVSMNATAQQRSRRELNFRVVACTEQVCTHRAHRSKSSARATFVASLLL